VLLVDSLFEDYTQSWTEKFATAFDSFRNKLANAAKTKYDETPDEYWSRYGLFTRSNTDRPDTIERRHQFFVEKMYESIQPRLKDSLRAFGELEKELIYYRDKKVCQLSNCSSQVLWADAEIHHVEPHSKGGPTSIANGALVHKACHPKSAKAVEDFAEHWRMNIEKQRTSRHIDLGRSAVAANEKVRVRRGRPKIPIEEKLVNHLIKCGLSPEAARESYRQMTEQLAGTPKESGK